MKSILKKGCNYLAIKTSLFAVVSGAVLALSTEYVSNLTRTFVQVPLTATCTPSIYRVFAVLILLICSSKLSISR
jgi:uncharacterized membrane protein YdcZ (DUF606 family)